MHVLVNSYALETIREMLSSQFCTFKFLGSAEIEKDSWYKLTLLPPHKL